MLNVNIFVGTILAADTSRTGIRNRGNNIGFVCPSNRPVCTLTCQAEAEAALEEAIPALEDAARALADLRKEDITEIRSFAKPHQLVQKVRPFLDVPTSKRTLSKHFTHRLNAKACQCA